MVGKEDIYRMLREEEIWHEITEHPAVYNMEEMAQIKLPYPEADAKNLFVRDSKRRDYYLITVRGDKRVDLKQFRQQNQTRSLSFASAEELGELLGLIPGAVTPLGLLNDGDRRVSFYLDASFCRPEAQKIGVHPNDNTATLWLQVEDLLREGDGELPGASLGRACHQQTVWTDAGLDGVILQVPPGKGGDIQQVVLVRDLRRLVVLPQDLTVPSDQHEPEVLLCQKVLSCEVIAALLQNQGLGELCQRGVPELGDLGGAEDQGQETGQAEGQNQDGGEGHQSGGLPEVL